jgi:hypothetical protein
MQDRARKKTDRKRAAAPPLEDIDWSALPSDEEGERLRAALRALQVGDHRRVRELTNGLREAKSELVRTSAALLAKRISVDPAQLIVLGLCAAFFVAMVLVYLR